MLKAEVKNKEGKKVGSIELKDDIFGIKINDSLVHQVYVVQYSNARKVIAHTKDRSERAGSGRKPWRQKGTGRARVGSARTPIWRKGGVVFGPTNERNFSKKVNKKMKNLAVKMVLTSKLKDKEIVVLENYGLENKKTKEAGQILENLKLEKKVLWAFSNKGKEGMRATRNLNKVNNIIVDNLNVFDLLNNKYLLIDKEGIKQIEQRFLGKEEEDNKNDSKETEKVGKKSK